MTRYTLEEGSRSPTNFRTMALTLYPPLRQKQIDIPFPPVKIQLALPAVEKRPPEYIARRQRHEN
jgi:hypothetical protein